MELTALAGAIASVWVVANIAGSIYHNYMMREYARREAEAVEKLARGLSDEQ